MRVLLTGGAGYVGSGCFRAFRRKGVEAFVLDDLSEGHARRGRARPPRRRRPARHRGGGARPPRPRHHPCRALRGEDLGPRIAPGPERLLVDQRRRLAQPARGDARRPASGASSSPARRRSTPTASTGRSARPTRSCRPRPTAPPSSRSSTCSRATPTPTASAPPRCATSTPAAPTRTARTARRTAARRHVIPLLLQAALGQRRGFKVFGDAWPTPDGSCIRDFVSIVDLAEAHLLALRNLAPGRMARYNLGSGASTSVRELLAAAERRARAARPALDRGAPPGRPGDPRRRHRQRARGARLGAAALGDRPHPRHRLALAPRCRTLGLRHEGLWRGRARGSLRGLGRKAPDGP